MTSEKKPEDIEVDIYVPMPPTRKYTVKAWIRKITKAKPYIGGIDDGQ